jgi:nucleolar protein 9
VQEKIARSLVPHEHTLLGSEYGRYFARKLQLHVLRRRPDEWKEIMSGTSASGPRSVSATAAMISPLAVVPNGKQSTFNAAGDDTDDAEGKKAKKKRKADEIDALFEDAGLGPGGKKKRAVLVASAPTIPQIPHEALEQTEIQDGEIEEGRKKRKRNKKRVNKEDGGPDKGLQDVLGAIIAAPKGEKGSRKKSKTIE